MDNLIKAGKLGKTHGTKGELSIHLDVEVDWDKITSVFIELDNTPVPYVIEYFEYLGNKTIVKLKMVSSIEEAKKLTNKNIWLLENCVYKDIVYDWIDFVVIDSNTNTPIGKITDWIIQNNAEWMILSGKDNKEIILPFHDELIDKIDEENKIIMYKAVEGLY
ncbi:MAG: hypothetical protein N2203_02240 [Bacteroidia bacterium]|nr:hypothetical protein [Bacteroidia bacterium]